MKRGKPRRGDAVRAPSDTTAPTAPDGEGLAKAGKRKNNGNGANLGFEAQLFLAADKLRKNLEPSDYKHVALGLIFLKYISNAFEAKRAALLAEDPAVAEDPDEYLAENVFWVPKEVALVPSARQRQAANHRQADRRRNVRDREVQSRPQGRAAQGLQSSSPRQGDGGRIDRPCLRDRDG